MGWLNRWRGRSGVCYLYKLAAVRVGCRAIREATGSQCPDHTRTASARHRWTQSLPGTPPCTWPWRHCRRHVTPTNTGCCPDTAVADAYTLHQTVGRHLSIYRAVWFSFWFIFSFSFSFSFPAIFSFSFVLVLQCFFVLVLVLPAVCLSVSLILRSRRIWRIRVDDPPKCRPPLVTDSKPYGRSTRKRRTVC